MELTSTVDRRFFQNTMDACTSIGIDIAAICAKRGLDNPLDTPGERLPLAPISRLYDAIAEETGDPEYLYKVAQAANMAGVGTLFQLISCCATLFDAMRLVCRYSSIASDVVSYSFHERGTQIDMLVTPCRDAYVSAHQLEASLFLVNHYRRMTPASRGPLLLEAWFRHAPRFPVSNYEQHFGCPVYFNQNRNGIRLAREALETPLPGADGRLQDYYKAMAERYESSIGVDDALTRRVQRLFLQRMAFGEPDREDIARALNSSVRTLQRQLREQGISYRELIEAARLSAAKHELTDATRPVHEVAFLLGYSDVRAFRRAFLRWTGQAPQDFRRNARG